MSKLLKHFLIFIVMIIFPMAFSLNANAEQISIDNSIQYTLSNGSVYWETSSHFGSGVHGTVCKGNRYTHVVSDGFPVWIDGYSVLDKNGNILKSYFDEKVHSFVIPDVADGQELMVHVWGMDEYGYRLGWVSFSQVNFSNDKIGNAVSEIPEENEEDWFKDSEEKTVEATVDVLIRQMEEDLSIPRESYILADFSGSMISFQEDVLMKLEGASGKRYVFAEDVEEFVYGKDCLLYDIGGATNIANVLNTICFNSDSHIYLLSDLNDNCGTEIELNEDFCGEITIVYYPVDYMYANDFMQRLRAAYPNAIITGF